MLAMIAAVSLSALEPGAHRGLLTAQVSPAHDRELTIKALREEIAELKDEQSGIGFVFPSLCIAAGVALAVVGTTVRTGDTWFRPAFLIGGTAIAALSTLWLILRIAKSISLGSQISGKEEQVRELEAQRVRVGVAPLPGGGAYGELTVSW